MKEFIDKLISRLEEKFKYNSEQAEIYRDGSDTDAYFREKKDLYLDRANTYGEIRRIVNQLAEEYKQEHDDTDYANIELYAFWQKHQWIPCSERLPKKGQKVLVTYEDRYIGGCNDVCEGMYIYSWKSWDIEDYDDADDFKVLAWQPLPEPYQPKGEQL